jgi:O-antigen ligase
MGERSLPHLRPRTVALLVVPVSLLTGVLMARHTVYGVTATAALLYGPLIFLNLAIGLVLWVPLTFMNTLHFAWSGPAVVSVLLFAAWIGTLSAARRERAAVLAKQRFLVTAIVALLVWLTLSLAWSRDLGAAGESLVDWFVAGAVFLVIATTIRGESTLRLMLLAFVFGGVVSVIIGVATTGLSTSSSAVAAASQAAEGRLTGGSGDPNYLAAGAVASVVVAIGLFATTRNSATRLGLAVAIAVLVSGVVASESRGGLLASGGAAIAALILFRRQRLLVGTVLGVIVGIGLLLFATNPGAWHRVTNFNGGGTGRSDLWRIAWRVGGAHPVVGVGLNNFLAYEAEYVREPGTLTSVALIADRPHVVHNQYLEAFTETGIVGFLLLIAVIGGILSSGLRAVKAFDAGGQRDLATLARAVVVAEISILIALIFLSDGPDQRYWILFGISAAMLGMAPRQQRSRRRRRASVRAQALTRAIL